jgi:hypothetical protein
MRQMNGNQTPSTLRAQRAGRVRHSDTQNRRQKPKMAQQLKTTCYTAGGQRPATTANLKAMAVHGDSTLRATKNKMTNKILVKRLAATRQRLWTARKTPPNTR